MKNGLHSGGREIICLFISSVGLPKILNIFVSFYSSANDKSVTVVHGMTKDNRWPPS